MQLKYKEFASKRKKEKQIKLLVAIRRYKAIK